MTNATNMSFRVDKDLKKEADVLFKKLGINTSVAINMFLSQCVREQAIPFNLAMEKRVPSVKLLKALEEAEEMEKYPENYKPYTLNEFKNFLIAENDDE